MGGPESLSFDIVWDCEGNSNVLTVNCSEKAQLDQWIDVMKIISPSDALSMSLDSTDGMPYILFSSPEESVLQGDIGISFFHWSCYSVTDGIDSL